jgi:hypothetical protein
MYKKIISKILTYFLRIIFGRLYHPNYFKAEKNIKSKIPSLANKYSLKERLMCFFNGFNSDKLILYDFNKYDKNLYISDIEVYRDIEKAGWKYYYIAHDKLVFERYFGSLCKVINSIGIIHDGVFYKASEDCRINNFSELIDEIKNGLCVFLKPRAEGSGRGIIRVLFQNRVIKYNDEEISISELINRMKKLNGYLVQEEFKQTGFSNEIWPHTVNTIRVATMMSPKKKEPFVAWSHHRFGTKGTVVDNMTAGGVFAPINVSNGYMNGVYRYPYDGKLKKYKRHPDSHKLISGLKVPLWEDIAQLAIELHKNVPFMPICGWDIILSGRDIYVQELNYNPNIYAGQIIGPLLLNPQVKEFYNYYIKKVR